MPVSPIFTGKLENYLRVKGVPYPAGANLLSWLVVEELVRSMPLPAPLKRWVFRTRQRAGYTRGDGITAATVPGVEAIYSNTLAHLQAIFETRPFILGDKPSIANIGMSGPFFRHFGLDPIPLEIMRQQAPAVFEWMARLWNTRLGTCEGDWLPDVPADAQATVQQLLEKHGGWEPLWRQAELPLLPGQEQQLPFKGSYQMVGINEQKLRT